MSNNAQARSASPPRLDTNDGENDTKVQKKVRFSSNFVKEFLSVSDDNFPGHTIWSDCTYEEPIESSTSNASAHLHDSFPDFMTPAGGTNPIGDAPKNPVKVALPNLVSKSTEKTSKKSTGSNPQTHCQNKHLFHQAEEQDIQKSVLFAKTTAENFSTGENNGAKRKSYFNSIAMGNDSEVFEMTQEFTSPVLLPEPINAEKTIFFNATVEETTVGDVEIRDNLQKEHKVGYENDGDRHFTGTGAIPKVRQTMHCIEDMDLTLSEGVTLHNAVAKARLPGAVVQEDTGLMHEMITNLGMRTKEENEKRGLNLRRTIHFNYHCDDAAMDITRAMEKTGIFDVQTQGVGSSNGGRVQGEDNYSYTANMDQLCANMDFSHAHLFKKYDAIWEDGVDEEANASAPEATTCPTSRRWKWPTIYFNSPQEGTPNEESETESCGEKAPCGTCNVVEKDVCDCTLLDDFSVEFYSPEKSLDATLAEPIANGTDNSSSVGDLRKKYLKQITDEIDLPEIDSSKFRREPINLSLGNCEDLGERLMRVEEGRQKNARLSELAVATRKKLHKEIKEQTKKVKLRIEKLEEPIDVQKIIAASMTLTDKIRQKARNHEKYKILDMSEECLRLFVNIGGIELSVKMKKDCGTVVSLDIDVLDEKTNDIVRWTHKFFHRLMNPQRMKSCIGPTFSVLCLLDYLEYEVEKFGEILIAVYHALITYTVEFIDDQLFYRHFTFWVDVEIIINLSDFDMEKATVRTIIHDGQVSRRMIEDIVAEQARDAKFPLNVLAALDEYFEGVSRRKSGKKGG